MLFYLGYSEFLAKVSFILTFDLEMTLSTSCSFATILHKFTTCLRYYSCEGRCKLRITFPGCGIILQTCHQVRLNPNDVFINQTGMVEMGDFHG